MLSDGAPPDGTPIKIRHTVKIGLVVLFDLLAVSGILFTAACLVFNIVFRNKRYVTLNEVAFIVQVVVQDCHRNPWDNI